MNKQLSQTAIALLALFTAASASAQQVYVYPNKGQSAKQQQKDTTECYQSAIVTVGYDPARVQHSSGPAPSSSDTSVGRGVARGAVGGAILGEIGGGDHTGGAAAAGAIFGGIRSSRKKQQEQEQQQQYYQQQQAQNAHAQANFNRAYSACLESRGYTAK